MNIELNTYGRQRNSASYPIYPTINIACSPRAFQQRINNDRIPLCAYKQIIRASNCQKSHDGNFFVDSRYLTSFKQKDGMIFNFGQLAKKNIREKDNGIYRQLSHIKILICICMYNQSRNAINLTLNGIYANLPHFQKAGISIGDIGVVLIQDGILKLVADRKKRTYAKGKQSMVELYKMMDWKEGKQKCDLEQRINIILDEMQNYHRGRMSDFIARNSDFPPSIEKSVSLLYQNLWYPSKTDPNKKDDVREENQKYLLKTFSCFKHLNGTKLSSHLWFFEGFCRYIKPQFCVLLDVGTKPDQTGLINLIKGFTSQQIGGVTGFMSVDANFQSEQGGDEQGGSRNCFRQYFYSIQRAQEFEYIISHFLDKNAESALAFLHVLPGAWSAYRYKALIQTDRFQQNLLQKSYFKMILNPNLTDRDYMEANMYLAEDRILSLGIYCQVKANYLLKYVPDATAYTDPMKTHKDLMMQRRRWINSSMFAFLYVMRNSFYNVMESKHNFFRRYITLNLSMLIALLSFVNSYFIPSIYMFILYTTIMNIGGYGSLWDEIAKVASFIYVIVFGCAVGGGLIGKSWCQKAHAISYVFTGFTILLLALVVFNLCVTYFRIFNGYVSVGNSVILILVITIGITIFCQGTVLLMHLPTHPRFLFKLIMDIPSYIAYQGAYSQTMVAHSFCNVDDVSWGTKGSTGAHGGGKKYETQKVFFVSSWIFYNCLLSAIFIYIDIVVPAQTASGGGSVLLGLAIYGAGYLLVKSILAMMYHAWWVFFKLLGLCIQDQPQIQRKNQMDFDWENHAKKWNESQENIRV